MTDIVLINPGDRKQVFQGLGSDISAIEPPYLLSVIATKLRDKDFSVSVIDSNAENISAYETAAMVIGQKPLLTALIVYGGQPSASTQNMDMASKICTAIKSSSEELKIAIGGLHPSALPERTLAEEDVDFVIDGEGYLTLENLLFQIKSGKGNFSSIKGLWWNENNAVKHTERYPTTSNIDNIFTAAAWDLLPMDKYRAHNWHCFDDIEDRQPYAAIYTSLGCPFSCDFCCINAPFGKPRIRYRSSEKVLDEIELLVKKYSIKNLKIIDELFVLDAKHYMPIINGIIERKYKLNIWAYARVDTIDFSLLPSFKKAGVNWLALGIESSNPAVMKGVSKGFRNKGLRETVDKIREEGIRIIGNYIFGLPDDDHSTMQETLDLALDLNCEFTNFYCAMAYPGSKLYQTALNNGWQLPEKWSGFSQHSYDTLPLQTKYLTAEEVLKFRDDAFHTYFSGDKYIDMIKSEFSPEVLQQIRYMTSLKLKRRILGD
jgi:radical SAM superfamily enzyme YgiQ (UPF0313 family)